ncbi:NIPSNAP family protein [Asanoa iriomotensis]|uniref:NIPSNAP family containing protein n=1 Tax=Asanoa iriomotensis TaxID=234613 RepID=A0ABQ4BU07_9ACTN|nr:NIPSNAP family protein [Asanoa iriomotensis]GIF54014.1 NIPSNAP family containing protein [Asanoa iriomotensis]
MTIVELRQYTLVPGGRDTLVALFDARFVESQEAEGMRIVGQFRDLDRPERFVWVREFPTMAVRHAALTAFYSGPVWKAHRDAANATMVDVDDVLLMRGIQPFTGGASRDVAPPPGSVVVAGLCPLAGPSSYASEFDRAVRPRLGVEVLGTAQTIHEPNDFPALPVREGEDVFVWFARLDGDFDGFAAHVATLGLGPVQLLRLEPTPRSALR